MRNLHLPGIINVLGVLLLINTGLMLLCLPFAFYYPSDDALAISLSVLVTGCAGFLLWYFTKKRKDERPIKKREGFLIVTFGWLIITLFGTLPYLFSGSIPSFTDAFFETISGFTTTGASVLDNIQEIPEGILFWRSLTQWLGGLGMIVLAIAILPILGIGGMQMFIAEAPGITPDKLKPRIKDTAKRLYGIYIGLTLLQTIFLMAGGMSFFDALNHSTTTVSTGGFSTKQASIAYWNSAYIEYVIILFMFIGGTNFVIIYFLIKKNFKAIIGNEEFRWYFYLVGICTIIVTGVLYFTEHHKLEIAFREAVFQVIAVITTTGFASADFTTWGSILMLFFFGLMFMGASTGSTSGGIKIARHVIIGKNSITEFNRQLHPSAIIPVKFNGKSIYPEIIQNILAFVIIYLTIFVIGSLTMTLFGLDLLTSVGAAASAIGNVGPGLNTVGPNYTFAHIPDAGKWVLSFLMLIGRLELFTVLILFTRYFWRST